MQAMILGLSLTGSFIFKSQKLLSHGKKIIKSASCCGNGQKPGKRYSVRSIQHLMQKALLKVGLERKHHTIHTIATVCHAPVS